MQIAEKIDTARVGTLASQRLGGSVSTYWLFSREIDLTVFLGSAVASLLLLVVGWHAGILNGESPEWTWVMAVLFIDVAHVWSTSFRVYFDKEEFKRRFWLYLLVPVFGYAIGVALYSEGDLVFWKALATVAVFHFVRQQYGWVNLYRRKLGETKRWTWWVDAAAVYLASIYPLAFWMTRLPRNFEWFVQNDFFSIAGVCRDSFVSHICPCADRVFRQVHISVPDRGIPEYRQGHSCRDNRDLLVCRHRLFQLGLRLYRDKRHHPRRAVFCADLRLCTDAARIDGARLSHAVVKLACLSRNALGDRLCRRVVLASRCLA